MKIVDWYSKTIKPGQKFFHNTILSTHRKEGTYDYLALCQCDCGSPPRMVNLSQIYYVKSCGCRYGDQIKHKYSPEEKPVAKIHHSLMNRCYDQTHKSYELYGGRGITVDKNWHDVINFLEDMVKGYRKGLQIDRIDNSKGYSKENCRWVTRKQQQRNTRRNVLLTHNGKTLTLAEWSETNGIPYGTLLNRIRREWTAERALTSPVLSDADIRCAHSRSFRHNVTI